MLLILMSILIPVAVCALAAWLAHHYDWKDRYGRPMRITRPEFGAIAVFVVLVTVLVTQVIGDNLARENAINGYKQFLNGSVTEAVIDETKCERDGSCRYEYDCDPEYHPEQKDSDGNVTQHAYTEWHDCPYADKELRYALETNLPGDRTITIGDNYFEPNPRQWRSGSGIPDDVPRQPPARWLKAEANVAAGISDPVTVVDKYPNYVLAADSELYQKYNGNIAAYQKVGLLPKHTANLASDEMLYDYGMRASKVQAVGGLKVANLPKWQNRLMRFNAAVGSDFQGDMHIVLVPASKVADSQKYITSLKAYWTRLGKWSIAKNGIILAIGVSPDGKSVEWSRSDTGMPFGNNTMRTALDTQLAGKPLDPGILLGHVTTSIREEGKKTKVVYDHSSSGVIGQIVTKDYPFKRACMQCEGAEDQGTGYVDLKDLVPIATGAKIGMFLAILVASALFIWTMLYFNPFNAVISGPGRTRRSSGR